jgi:hypothetical protein
MGMEFQDEKVLEMDGGDDHTTRYLITIEPYT